MLHVELCGTAFEPWRYLAEWQQQHLSEQARSGATAVFVGTMRDFNEGDDVASMFLEHYPGMTERQLEGIADEAVKKWQLHHVCIVHRIGNIQPAETIVLVAVWAAHRAEAFTACRHIMEILKHQAPFWKKETLADGGVRWVDKNTPG